MAGKKAKAGKTTEVRLHVPEDLKMAVRKFRGESFSTDKPITSDEKAILIAARRGLKMPDAA